MKIAGFWKSSIINANSKLNCNILKYMNTLKLIMNTNQQPEIYAPDNS